MNSNKYNTKQRSVILSFLKNNPHKCMTVDEISAQLASNGLNVGKTTVYRTLNSLNECGEVRKYITYRGDSATYQYIDKSECKSHLHLKCTECGEVIHVDCEFNDEIANHFMNHHSFELDTAKTVIYGKCNKCTQK